MSHDAQEEAARALDEARRKLGVRAGKGIGVGLGALVAGMLLGRLRRAVRRVWGGRRWRRLGLGLLIVVLSVTTCSFGVDTSTLTAEWGEPVPASAEDAARALTRAVDALRRAAETGAVRFTMTESEATSALSIGLMTSDLMQAAGRIPQEEIQQASDLEALRERIWREADLQRQERAARSGFIERLLLKLDPRIRTGDVQVRFEESGELVAAGYVQAWRFRQPGVFVVAPSARDGRLTLDFVSGRLGRLPLPELIFDWFGGIVARGIMLGQRYAEVSQISVGEGTFTVAARLAE